MGTANAAWKRPDTESNRKAVISALMFAHQCSVVWQHSVVAERPVAPRDIMGCIRHDVSVAGSRLLSESVRRVNPLARTNTDMTIDARAMSGGGFRRAILGLVAVLMSLGVGLGITRILEWGAGWRLYASHRNAGLIWGPYSVVDHATEEFSYQARIDRKSVV